ncbi:MAG: kinase/pyrophosphorylase [Anaerolineaceae bacterium]|nr:kinase/pyrophosphorylase [Anaerolineaceae bacterium]
MTVSQDSIPSIFIISGGVGASGEQLVYTALAQYPADVARVTTIGNVRQPEQVRDALRQAQQAGALVVHTLVDSTLQQLLVTEAARTGVRAVDVMGPILEWVSGRIGHPPAGQPGLYRHLNRDYFDRVAAIDFTLKHDDGKRREGWPEAEAMLVGVSRVGKTPLSIYLAVLGWKVANYPCVPQIPVPEALFSLDPRRVFGLTIEPGQLLQYRSQRQRQLGVTGASSYVDPKAVFEEVQSAEAAFKRGRFTVINMTDKTIELGADEIIRHLTRIEA